MYSLRGNYLLTTILVKKGYFHDDVARKASPAFLSSGFHVLQECETKNKEFRNKLFSIQAKPSMFLTSSECRQSKLCCATVITMKKLPVLSIEEQNSMILPPLLHLQSVFNTAIISVQEAEFKLH